MLTLPEGPAHFKPTQMLFLELSLCIPESYLPATVFMHPNNEIDLRINLAERSWFFLSSAQFITKSISYQVHPAAAPAPFNGNIQLCKYKATAEPRRTKPSLLLKKSNTNEELTSLARLRYWKIAQAPKMDALLQTA